MYATSTIPLFLGAKKFFTTLTQAIGVTTKTEYEPITQTVQGSNGLLGGLNFGGQPQIGNRVGGGGVIVTSEAVTKETTVPSTVTKVRHDFPLLLKLITRNFFGFFFRKYELLSVIPPRSPH